jgi:hypothetical protein
MFQCDTCHTEYGGIRGIAAGTCPRCRQQQASLTRPVAASTSLAAGYSESLQASPSTWSVAPLPLVGEIARLDRAVRF